MQRRKLLRATFSLLEGRGVGVTCDLHNIHQQMYIRRMSEGSFSRTLLPEVEERPEKVNSSSLQTYRNKMSRYKGLVQASLDGGGPRGIERHVKTNKKVRVRDRIRMLIDPATSFLEIGGLAGFEMPYGDLPAAGSVAGIGRVKGVYCLINGNDATVKAGTYFPIIVQKGYRTQELADINRLPSIYIPDSGGAFLPLQSQIFPDKKDGGRSFYNQAVMSAKGIPQIAIVCGSCTAGGAYVPTMSDEAIIINRIGKIFLGGPPLVKAALGEIVTDEELGGAFMHSSVSGCTDYFAKDEAEAFEMCRDVIESLNMTTVPHPSTFQEPVSRFSWEDIEGKEHLNKVEMYGILSKILDGSSFKEFKVFYGIGLITGMGYIQGNMVGIVVNTDKILGPEALKASHFMNLCNRRDIPVIFLQNSLPYDDSSKSEELDSETIKSRGNMVASVATLSVPKISITLTACYDDDYLLMCGPSFSPNFNLMWPTSKMSPFDMTHPFSKDERKEDELDAFYAAFNMLTDAVILPQDTRPILGEILEILKQQKLNPMREGLQAPVFRM